MRLGLLGLAGVAVLELWLLLKLSAAFGAAATVLLVIASAMVGLWLLRVEGFRTLLRASQRMEAGEIPAQEVVEGGLLAVGALMLVLPGPLSDVVGLVCVLPPSRRWLARSALPGRIMRPFDARPESRFGATSDHRDGRSAADFSSRSGSPPPASTDRIVDGGGDPSHTTIEGEYRRED